jgi:hypothetical protein
VNSYDDDDDDDDDEDDDDDDDDDDDESIENCLEIKCKKMCELFCTVRWYIILLLWLYGPCRIRFQASLSLTIFFESKTPVFCK